ncbi:hypothetical protein [Thioflavicoccus mobilis]|uniref:hypothetical protein n=1 Tax=Thioflavicoccus mobilis TaxID=80679 RepID=UPI0009FBA2FE|nr:hypothetical protein [Thioflavicoccus mobilis]
MFAFKERMADAIQNQPKNTTHEETVRELAFEQIVASSLQDSKERKTTSNHEMNGRLRAEENRMNERSSKAVPFRSPPDLARNNHNQQVICHEVFGNN